VELQVRLVTEKSYHHQRTTYVRMQGALAELRDKYRLARCLRSSSSATARISMAQLCDSADIRVTKGHNGHNNGHIFSM